MSEPGYPPTALTRVRRHPERGRYDEAAVHAVLDAALMAHVGYLIDGRPLVTPTLFWREGRRLLLARRGGQPDAEERGRRRAGVRRPSR